MNEEPKLIQFCQCTKGQYGDRENLEKEKLSSEKLISNKETSIQGGNKHD